MELYPQSELPPGDTRPVILRTVGLIRRFGSVNAVDGLDLSVRQGEIYGFLGRNGAGKTTTLRMLMGILRPDSGHIEFFGRRIRRTGPREKRRIGYLSQDQNFYRWMSCRRIGQFSAGLYPTWDVHEYDRLLAALELPPERKVSELSGGMKLKLALALALAHRPPLLLLDEPTSGLDPVARREFLEAIVAQARTHRRTTLFSTHRVDEVEEVADQVGILQKGRLCFQGDLQTLHASVRLINFSDDTQPPLDNLPPGFELLREENRNGTRRWFVHGSPEAWSSAVSSSHPLAALAGRAEAASLEQIFIAFAGGTISEL